MGGKGTCRIHQLVSQISATVKRMRRNTLYNIGLWIFGLPTMLAVLIVEKLSGSGDSAHQARRRIRESIIDSEMMPVLREQARSEILRKNEFFGRTMSPDELDKEIDKAVEFEVDELVASQATKEGVSSTHAESVQHTFERLLQNPLFLALSLIHSLPMYVLIAIYRAPYVKYVFERVVMMLFVLFGVTIVVFTIIYISPTDPAASVLGPDAPKEAIENFRKAYGLNDPYLKQLWGVFRKVLTFNLGSSYVGHEDIATAIGRKFPVTLQIGIASMAIAVFIAMPAGIISAMRQYSGLDYGLMLVALLGLSIPNFWLGLILILQFAINLKWLPATYKVGNLLTIIMPAFVVGTGMSASLARMTRSSMLEVARQDYVVMARAKGLSENKVVVRHILKNALLPIITVFGMQFAATLSGAATTEKVFNIKGMCEYISSRTLLPDTPVVIGGVIYIALAISISNLVIDLFYTFIDPRLKTRLENY